MHTGTGANIVCTVGFYGLKLQCVNNMHKMKLTYIGYYFYKCAAINDNFFHTHKLAAYITSVFIYYSFTKISQTSRTIRGKFLLSNSNYSEYTLTNFVSKKVI